MRMSSTCDVYPEDRNKVTCIKHPDLLDTYIALADHEDYLSEQRRLAMDSIQYPPDVYAIAA